MTSLKEKNMKRRPNEELNHKELDKFNDIQTKGKKIDAFERKKEKQGRNES